MRLPGRLSASTLGDLLGTLHRSRITGLLELSEIGPSGGALSSRVHRIHLRTGLVSAVQTCFPTPPLGEILRREGLIDLDTVRRLLRLLAAGDPRPAGEILIALGAVPDDFVQAALRAQLRYRLDSVFCLGDAIIAFRPPRPEPKQALRIVPLMPHDFLHGRPRVRDMAGPSSHVRVKQTASRSDGAKPAARKPASVAAAAESATANRAANAHASRPPFRSERVQAPSRGDAVRAEALRKLGLPPHAGSADIRRAFRRLAVELHPDRHAGAPARIQDRNAARFAEVSAAYHLLVA